MAHLAIRHGRALASARLLTGPHRTEGIPMLKRLDIAAATASLAQRAQRAIADRGDAPQVSEPVPECHVFTDQTLADRDGALDFIAQRAVELGLAHDADELKEALLRREVEGTTGMMDGFAIPHAKAEAIERVSVLVVKDADGIEGWDTMDELPVHVAIALLVPVSHGAAAHLRLLSKLADALMDEGFRASVKSCDDPEEIATLVGARFV